MDGMQAADQMQQSVASAPPQQQAAPVQTEDASATGQIAPVAQPQVPKVDPYAHDTAFGRAAKALLGSTTDYTVDPKTGQTVATQTPTKPGQFWKNVLAAAVLGGAAGANGDPRQGFAGGITRGGAAEQENLQKQDLLKRQQARQQFEDQNAASANQRAQNADTRAEQEAVTHQQLAKAQIAQANAETYRTNVLTQGATYDQHQKIADAGKQHFSDYAAAGLQPIMKDIPEAEMQQTIANRPGASTYDWEATGVKPILDAQGNPTYVYTYSAYDPKGQIPVSKGTIDQWKADGMDKMFPDLFNMVKAGKSIDAQQYVELKRTDAKLFNDNLVRSKAAQETAEGKAKIAHENAEAGRAWAEAAEARARKGQLDLAKNQTQALDEALSELSDPKKANGDFSKLSPKSKVVIGESAKVMLPSLEAEAREALQADPSDSQGIAKQAMQQADVIRKLALQAITGSPSQIGGTSNGDPRVAASVAALKGKSAGEVEQNLASLPIPEASKDAIRQGLGIPFGAQRPQFDSPKVDQKMRELGAKKPSASDILGMSDLGFDEKKELARRLGVDIAPRTSIIRPGAGVSGDPSMAMQ